MRDLMWYANDCIEELKTYGIDCSNLSIDWKINSRAKKRYGLCKCLADHYEINISSFMLDEDILKDDLHLRNTIIHELLHAVTPESGHKGMWKELAAQVNLKSNGKYNIKRCTSYEEKGIDMSRSLKKIRYTIKCKSCGCKYYRQKKTKLVKHPDRYRCGVCNGKLELTGGII